MNRSLWIFATAGLLVALCLAVFVSPYASSAPDGLDRVAADKGFLDKVHDRTIWRHALMPDYLARGLGDGPLSTAAAGLFGTLCAFAVGCVLARLVRRPTLGVPTLGASASLPASSPEVNDLPGEGHPQ